MAGYRRVLQLLVTSQHGQVFPIVALYSLFTAVVQWCAGDVVGHSVLEKIVAMIAMLIGATVFG